MKSVIKDLNFTIDKAIIILVLNFLDFFFAQFLGILSYDTRKKE